MAGVTHPFVSAKSDDTDTSLVRPTNWNADHLIGDGAATLGSFSIKGPRPWADVRAWGALGTWDGAAGADDATAFQNTATAACAVNGGVMVIPEPEAGKSYGLGSSVTIEAPAAGTRVFCDIIAYGGTNVGATLSTITWRGADNTAVFKGWGWKYSHISGVVITIPGTSTGVIGWELDVDATRTSTAQLAFSDCLVRALTGATNPIGWRMGHTAGAGVGELSFLNWENCHVTHDTLNGGIGWVNEHLNGLNYNWYGGFGSKLAKMFTNISTAGAAQATGGGSMFFYGLGGSQNTMDFEFSSTGAYGIWGGRFELGTTFLHGNTGSYMSNVVVSGALIASYTVGQVFNIDHAMNLVLDGVQATGSAYDATFITLDCFIGQGVVTITGGGYRAPDPMWTVGSGTWKVNVLGAAILNASAQPTTYFADRIGGAVGIADGTFGTPGLNFFSDPDTGFYRIGANRLGVSVGGAQVGEISAAATAFLALGLNPSSAGVIRIPNNTLISGRNAANGADITIATLNASDQVVIRGNLTVGIGFASVTAFQAGNGSAGSPSFTFSSDTNSGMYNLDPAGAGDDVGFSAGANLIFEIQRTAATNRLGFYGITPVVRASALVQTYATAERTLANDTSADFPVGGVGTAAGGWDTAANRDLAISRFNALRVDVDDLKQFVNSLVDDMQLYGLEQ